MFGGNIHNVVHALARHLHSGQIERLRVNRSVYGKGEYLAKLFYVHVCRREHGFIQIGSGARVVILGSRDLSDRARANDGKQAKNGRSEAKVRHSAPASVKENGQKNKYCYPMLSSRLLSCALTPSAARESAPELLLCGPAAR